jgi:uncharacterized protein
VQPTVAGDRPQGPARPADDFAVPGAAPRARRKTDSIRTGREADDALVPYPLRAIFRSRNHHGEDLIGILGVPVLLRLGLVTLIAAALQGAAGFGFGLLALPAYMWILGSLDAVPLVIILNLLISLGLALRVRHDVHRALVLRLVVGALVGFPLGLLAFLRADSDQLMVAVSVLVLGFVADLALRENVSPPGPDEDPSFRGVSSTGVGAIAGAMTTALGLPGPPVALYLAGLAVSKDTLRATALTFFVISYAVSLALHTAAGGVSPGVWITAALLIPVALGGGLIGHWLSHYMSERVFRMATLALIGVTGAGALAGVLIR